MDFSDTKVCDKVWKEQISKLDKHELLKLLGAYDAYVWQIINENEGEPVCVAEFYINDY